MDTYDRDGKLIPDDYWDKEKYPDRRPFRWATEQRVGRTEVGEHRVSTVWLMGIDHGYGSGSPVIFETMIFGPTWNNELTRYSTEEAAMRGHLKAVDALRAGKPPFDYLTADELTP